MIPDTQSDADIEAKKDAVFIEQYRLTGDPVTACVRAGIRDPSYPITVVAQRQLQRPEIKAAVAALERIETSMMPLEVTRDSIVADMQSVYEKALQDGQYSAAISSKKLQSMLLNLLQTSISINHSFRADLMSDDQLMRIANGSASAKDMKIIEVEDDDE